MTTTHRDDVAHNGGCKVQARGAPAPTTLVDLPTEVLQIVLEFCTPASWLYLALSCRTCYDVASQYRCTLLYQLSQVPIRESEVEEDGRTNPYDQEHVERDKKRPTIELFNLLTARLVSQLLGAGLGVSTTVWRLVRPYETRKQKRVVGGSFDDYENGVVDGQIDSAVSMLRRTMPDHVRKYIHAFDLKHVSYMDFALVRKDQNAHGSGDNGLTAFYACRDDPSALKPWLDLGMMLRQDQVVTPYAHPCKTQVLKVLVNDEPERTQLVSVLQRFSPDPLEVWANDATIPDGFRTEAYHLVHYIWDPESDGPSRVLIALLSNNMDYNPASIAVHSPHRVAVCWENRYDHTDRTVSIHTGNLPAQSFSTVEYLHYHEISIVDREGLAPFAPAHRRGANVVSEPITSMRFSDHGAQLLYHYKSSAIYQFFQTLQYNDQGVSSTSRVYHNRSTAGMTISPDERRACAFQICTPFYSKHIPDSVNHHPRYCTWRYLAVGYPTDPYAPALADYKEKLPCILRSTGVVRYTNCTHLKDLDRGRRFDGWVIVARLAGWPQGCDIGGSLLKIAYSRSAHTRIAIADNDNVVRVWNVRSRFFASALVEYNPRQFRYPHSITRDGCVELEPMYLHLRGSAAGAKITDLQFSHDSDNILFALTDNGFMFRWDFNPSPPKQPQEEEERIKLRPSHQEISLRFPNPPTLESARRRLETADTNNRHASANGGQTGDIEDGPFPDRPESDVGSWSDSGHPISEDDLVTQVAGEEIGHDDDDVEDADDISDDDMSD